MPTPQAPPNPLPPLPLTCQVLGVRMMFNRGRRHGLII